MPYRNKDYDLHLSFEDFDSFRRELNKPESHSIYYHLGLLEYACKVAKQLLETGKDIEGNDLTEQEMDFTKRILHNVKHDFQVLKDEYSDS